MKQLGHILILEDDPSVLETLESALGTEFAFYPCENLAETEHLLDTHTIDAVILDYALTFKDGTDLLAILQKRSALPPVILTCSEVNLEMAVKLLKRRLAGFLEKPVVMNELRELLRSAVAARTEKREINAAGFRVIFATRTVSVNDKVVSLTPTEFEILSYFLNRPNTQISRKALIHHLWGHSRISKNALDTHLLNLKKKLPPFAARLVSVYGTGYCYEA